MNRIDLPQTMPRVCKVYTPKGWKQNCDKAVNKFYDNIYQHAINSIGGRG